MAELKLDKVYVCTPTWKSAQEFTTRIDDPLFIARELFKEEQLASLQYEAKFEFTVANVVEACHVMLEKENLSLDQVGELVMKHGVAQARNSVIDYIGEIVGSGSEETPDSEGSEGN